MWPHGSPTANRLRSLFNRRPVGKISWLFDVARFVYGGDRHTNRWRLSSQHICMNDTSNILKTSLRFILVIAFVGAPNGCSKDRISEINYEFFRQQISAGNVSIIEFDGNLVTGTFVTRPVRPGGNDRLETRFRVVLSPLVKRADLIKDLKENGVKFSIGR